MVFVKEAMRFFFFCKWSLIIKKTNRRFIPIPAQNKIKNNNPSYNIIQVETNDLYDPFQFPQKNTKKSFTMLGWQ